MGTSTTVEKCTVPPTPRNSFFALLKVDRSTNGIFEVVTDPSRALAATTIHVINIIQIQKIPP